MENVNVTLRRSIAAAVLLVPVLTSCGFNEPTDRVYNPGVGVNDRSGSVDVLHALVVSGADGSGTVVAALASKDDAQGDALTQIVGAGEDTDVQVDLTRPARIKPGGSVQLADESPVSIKGSSVKAGDFVTLTFNFERSKSVTLDVPVVARRNEFSNIPVPSVAPSTPTPSESSSSH